MIRHAAILLSAMLAVSASAGALEAPPSVLVIFAESAFTGAEVARDIAVVVENDRIREVVPSSGFVPPAGSRVIDARGMTVLPGLIDSHVHMLSMPMEYLQDVARYGWGRVAEESASLAPGNREQFLRCGVTGIIDMGGTLADLRRIEAGLEAGSLLGPDLLACGPLITAPDGHPAGTIYRGQHQLIDSSTVEVSNENDARRAVQRLQADGAGFIKIVYDDGAYYGRKVPQLDAAVARCIILEAHERGLRVMAHVGATESSFADILETGADGIEHCFPFGASEAVVRRMAEAGVLFTPTLSIYERYAPQVLGRMQETVAKAHEAGVAVVAGTDFPSTRFMSAGEGLFRELQLLESAGLSRIETLQAATVNAARKMGREDLGILTPGAVASLVLLDGDVREGELEPDRVRTVIVHGVVVIENKELSPSSRSGFSRKPMMAAPTGSYDTVSGVSVGGTLLYYNLLGTGIATTLSASASFQCSASCSLSIAPPSPVPDTSLAFLASYDGYPRRFYGLGNETSATNPVVYGSREGRASLTGITSLPGSFALTTGLLFQYSSISGWEGALPPEALVAGNGIASVASFTVAHDTRDSPGAPWYGDCESLSVSLSTPCLGSSWSFASLAVDLKLFWSPLRHHVLATRVGWQHCFGSAPFFLMPDHGGPLAGRGFPQDHFVGRIGVSAQLEYRFPIWSILGGVVFLDAGQVGDSYKEFSLQGTHLSAGAGLRVAFSDASIMAVDLGFSAEPRPGLQVWVRNGHAF